MSNGESYFSVTVEAGSEPARIIARGELDAASAPQLSEAVEEARTPACGIELDLADVTFIDSSGLRVIAAAVRRSGEAGEAFAIRAASDPVRRIFAATGLESLLTS